MATMTLQIDAELTLTPVELIGAARGSTIFRRLSAVTEVRPNQIAELFLQLSADDRALVFNELASRSTDLERPFVDYIRDILQSGNLVPQARALVVSQARHPLHEFVAGDTVELLVEVENNSSHRKYEIGSQAVIKWLDATGENLVLAGEMSVHYTQVKKI